MGLSITYQNVDSSKALSQFIERKSGKIQKFLNGPKQIEWICVFEDGHYESRLNIFNRGRHFNFSQPGENLYQAVNQVLNTASRVLGKKKNQIKNRIRKRKTLKTILKAGA